MWAILGGLILLAIILFMYFSPGLAHKITTTQAGPISLSSEEVPVGTQAVRSFYEDSEASFSAFVYVNPMMRTGAHVPCGDAPGQQRCNTGAYELCQCVGADCGQCDHAGFSRIFSIAGMTTLQVNTVPDAGRPASASTQLVVRTEGPSVTAGQTSPQRYVETLMIPPLPLQKWTMVTVARQGRRFDVYYNDQIVLSQTTQYMPVSTVSAAGGSGVNSGGEGISGQIALLNVYNYRLSTRDVYVKYHEMADTRGAPYLTSGGSKYTGKDPYGLVPPVSTSLTASLGQFGESLNPCAGGGCLNAPTIRPANPMYDWSVSFA